MSERKGYVVVEVDVTDADAYKDYTKLSVPAVAACGGRYVALGATSGLEGEGPYPRAAIVEFASVAKAQAFYESERYRAARKQRAGAARVRMFVVEGTDAPDMR
jgi:uncharacterized protein (DUF1330 family)